MACAYTYIYTFHSGVIIRLWTQDVISDVHNWILLVILCTQNFLAVGHMHGQAEILHAIELILSLHASV